MYSSFERDHALVAAMRVLGESEAVIEEFLLCLDISDAEREELRSVGRPRDMAGGDVIEMNPLTSYPQRSRWRG
jgi:hypothetical protein